MNMGRPFSSGAYSTTEPDGKPEAAPSEATVDKVPILQCTVLCEAFARPSCQSASSEERHQGRCEKPRYLATSRRVRASSAKSRRAAEDWC